MAAALEVRAEDTHRRWPAERRVVAAGARSRPEALFADVREWARANGEGVADGDGFVRRLDRTPGLWRRGVDGAPWVEGIRLGAGPEA